ncbi:MAG: N-acyl homoserine lactonase family protein, partial [Clostridia bacterium]|nr:N-acyl homoserine lactonase family protein [Clostridia bacterium]
MGIRQGAATCGGEELSGLSVRRVYLLEGGYLRLNRSIMIAGGDYGRTELGPVYMVLLETSEGWVLIDTGLNPLGVSAPEKAWGPRAKAVPPTLCAEDDVRYRLKQLGLVPEDVHRVIHTHLHWDHTGGNRFFPHATFLVQKAEYRFAFWPDRHFAGPYMRDHFDCGVKYELVEGDVEVMPGLYLLFTPGHTPGHQSVLVTLAGGRRLLFTGDAAYTMENLERTLPPGHLWSPSRGMESLLKLKTVQSLSGALVLPS